LLRVTQQALEEGIKVAQPGNTVAAIGRAVEGYVKSQGHYGIVRDLVGHGVGHEVHEGPHIPNYYDPGLESVILKPGMVIAIEPMISMNKDHRVVAKPDGWTIAMIDNALCAHFEHTLVITEKGNEVVTRRPEEKSEVLW
jgi:methionyl aminopeptidase